MIIVSTLVYIYMPVYMDMPMYVHMHAYSLCTSVPCVADRISEPPFSSDVEHGPCVAGRNSEPPFEATSNTSPAWRVKILSRPLRRPRTRALRGEQKFWAAL